jgi:putative DNA primase/helicase
MVNLKKKVLKDVGYKKKKKEVVLKEDFITIERKKDGTIKSVKPKITKLANYIIGKYNFKTVYETKSEKIFVFLNGIYDKSGREVIETQVEKILGTFCRNNIVHEISEKVKRKTAISREEFDKIPEELICLENGILNIQTLKLEKHNQKYYFKRKIPLEYNPKAKCPEILRFLTDTLYPEDIKPIQEWFGYNLYRKYFIKKAIITFGPTDTSKTVFLNLLSKWIGEKNISGLSLQRISSGDKFGLAHLKDKYSNIFDDLTTEDMISGGFKIATGGGYITAEYKFGDPFQFQSYAKLIFAGNKIPSVKDIDSEDAAYYSRWMPIPFDNQISEKEKNSFFIDKLTTKKELSGLLNWSLIGLKRLLDNHKFSFDKNWRDIKKIMERNSGDPLAMFCQDVLVEKIGNIIPKEALFEIYLHYNKGKDFPILSKSQISRRLTKYVKYVVPGNSKERYWKNIGISTFQEGSFANTDTLDTYSKILCKYSKSKKSGKKSKNNNLYMISENVSKVSEKNGEIIDTSDTFIRKDIEDIKEIKDVKDIEDIKDIKIGLSDEEFEKLKECGD